MIRLARVGATKQPHYRVVVIEKDRARNGRSIEVVGTYNPRSNPATVELKRERIAYWTSNGAQLSERVGKLLAAAPAVPAETPAADEPAKPAAKAANVDSAATAAAAPAASSAPESGESVEIANSIAV
jgi:small subunit ribosomal protein S16